MIKTTAITGLAALVIALGTACSPGIPATPEADVTRTVPTPVPPLAAPVYPTPTATPMPRIKHLAYTVKPGDTLTDIFYKCCSEFVPEESLQTAYSAFEHSVMSLERNNIPNRDLIITGQVIHIPVSHAGQEYLKKWEEEGKPIEWIPLEELLSIPQRNELINTRPDSFGPFY